MTTPRILIAGIGNIFLGDDAFGVEVVRRLTTRPLPPEVRVIDFGIRGMDLAYALVDGYETVILVDATPQGHAPGTLYLIEPQMSSEETTIDTHAMDPVKVLSLAKTLGQPLPRILLLGCEPDAKEEQADIETGLSAAVQSAVPSAVAMIESLIVRLVAGEDLNQTVESCTSSPLP